MEAGNNIKKSRVWSYYRRPEGKNKDRGEGSKNSGCDDFKGQVDDMPEVEILRMEIKKSYQKKCIGLLSQVLRVSRQSVLNWNSDELEFSKMPSYHRQTLGLFYEYRKLLTEVKRLRRFTC